MPECFVIMPITTPPEWVERYRGDVDHFKHVLDLLIAPSVQAAGYTVKPPAARGADLIQAEIVKNLEEADLVLCDMSTLNANVFFELGIRTALDRPVCLIKDEYVRVPFDTTIINYHQYRSHLDAWDLAGEIERVTAHVKAAREADDNALWRYFGLTRRGRPSVEALGGGDTDEHKLDLLLAEMRRLQGPDRAQVQRDEAVERLLDEVLVVAGAEGVVIEETTRTSGDRRGARLEVDLSSPFSAEARDRLYDTATRLGVDLALWEP